jgi:prepilin-type N-terminal cleavage/methylation domain-containing protein/prepilin-type processing-associated H-X9-DG protein
MRTLSVKRGFTLIELLVVIAIIAILASILFPVFAKAREKARQTTCLSQIRQIAIAAQMYDQDNNARYPGYSGWDSLLGNYLGNNQQMFTCPSDSSSTGAVNSYGYNGMLVRADGSGVNESVITAPTEVGVVCDASPSMTYGTGGVIGGGGIAQASTLNQIPAPRHSGGTVVGYCDGHAIYCPNGYNAQDISNNVTRAFYLVDALGLINSPGGGLSLPASGSITADTNTVTIGGDFATMPILTAAAEAYKASGQGGYYTRGFLGMQATTSRPLGSSTTTEYLWGQADGTGYNSSSTTQVKLGVDMLVFIVSKNTKIAAASFSNTTSSGVYSATTAQIQNLLNYGDGQYGYNVGYSANVVQAYTYAAGSGNVAFLSSPGIHVAVGNEAVVATDDQDMVNKVSADPYGIGFCSSAMADPNKVQILGIVNSSNVSQFYPQTNPKYRWIVPTSSTGLAGGFARTLYATFGTTEPGLAASIGTASTYGYLMSSITAGPLFMASYLTN